MITLNVFPERDKYIVNEEIQLTIQITNNTPTTIVIPDPTKIYSQLPEYTITGPDYPSGKTFSLFSLSQEKGNVNENLSDPPTISIEPGATWEEVIPLSSLLPLTSPGEYKITSSIKSDTITAESGAYSFNISELDIKTVHLGLGTRPLEEGEGEGAFIQKSADSYSLYSFVFKETRPDIGETEIISLVNRGVVSPSANEVMAPWRNSPFFNEMIRWLIWREGKNIQALNSIILEPLSFELQEEFTYLVKPALKTTDENVEVLVVSKNEKELSLITINDSSTEPGKSGEIKWKIPFPDKPTEISCALSPSSLNNKRHIAFVVQRVDGIEIFYTHYNQGTSPEQFQSVRLENSKMLINAPLAMFVDVEGKVLISVIVVMDEKSHTCALAEAEIGSDGKPIGNIKLRNIGSLPDFLTGGTILYAEKNGILERRDIVIVTENQGLYWSNADGLLRPISVAGIPTKPILLCPGKDVSYILYHDPKRGLYFEPL
ncbi:MAG: hypothetical protein QME58_10950 [Bacteroidota bacterium]|nr:hypothetical protein [Bacteroidota bacterium]